MGNKGHESLTEVFGPLWLIPLDLKAFGGHIGEQVRG